MEELFVPVLDHLQRVSEMQKQWTFHQVSGPERLVAVTVQAPVFIQTQA
jgi:hypothetical protein